MHYPKSYFALYGICTLKLLMTFIAFATGMVVELVCITITAVPMCLAMMFGEFPQLYFSILGLDFLIWCSIFVLSISGIFVIWARKGSVVAITMATAIDFLICFASPNVLLKIICPVVSSLVLLLCVKCFIDTKKITK